MYMRFFLSNGIKTDICTFFNESPKCVAGTVFYCIICRYLFSSMRVFREEDMSAMTMFPPSCTGLLGSPIGGGLDGGGIA